MSNKPFFARFLEKQEDVALEVETDVKAGADTAVAAQKPKTKAYPSDDDPTMKYLFDGYDSMNPPSYFTPGA